MQEAEKILKTVYSDRIFSVEDDVVWVSGMNHNCRSIANSMAKTLSNNDIPAGIVYEDNAELNGGVQFNYGNSA